MSDTTLCANDCTSSCHSSACEHHEANEAAHAPGLDEEARAGRREAGEAEAFEAAWRRGCAEARAAVLADLLAEVEGMPGKCHDGSGLGCDANPCVENVSRATVIAAIKRRMNASGGTQ